MTLPIAIIAPTAALVVSNAQRAAAGNWLGVQQSLTGMDDAGKFHAAWVIENYGPLAAGFVIHYAAGRFGMNRALGRAKVPLIRI